MPVDLNFLTKKLNQYAANKNISPAEAQSLQKIVGNDPQGLEVLRKYFANSNEFRMPADFKKFVGQAPVAPSRPQTKGTLAMIVPQNVRHLVVDAGGPDGLSLASAQRLAGANAAFIKNPGDLFRNHLRLNPGKLLPDALPAPELKAALNKDLVLTTEARTFQTEPGTHQARITFYGQDHAQIAKLIHDPELADHGVFFKDMAHFDSGFGAGPAEKFFEGDVSVLGNTHRGQLIPTFDKDNKPTIGWMDWPTDYGRLGSSAYGAKVMYWSPRDMEFENGRPTDDQIKSYIANMRTMGVLQMMEFPFAGEDATALYRDYKFNKLDLRDSTQVKKWMDAQANLASATAGDDGRKMAVYCAEGAWNNSNTPPVNQNGIDAGLISQETVDRLREMQRAWKEAPGSNTEKWQALVAKGFLKQVHVDKMARTGMLQIPFVLANDDVQPLSFYRPKGWATEGAGAGLNAKPITLGGIISGIMEANFPREKVGATIESELLKAFKTSPRDPKVVAQAAAVAQKPPELAADPANDAAIAAAFGKVLAQKYSAGILMSEGMQKTIRQQLRYDKMSVASRAVADDLIGRYLKVAANPELTPEQVVAEVRKLDLEAENIEVAYDLPVPFTDKMLVFVPPQHGAYASKDIGGAKMPGLRDVTYLMSEALK